MGQMMDSFLAMLGREPAKPQKFSEAAQNIHMLRRMDRADFDAKRAEVRAAHPEPSTKWRNRRWATLIVANLLFVISFSLDIQILEGALTASRFVGFHLIDLNSALLVMLAHKHIIVNLLIGTLTIFVFWVLFGGRAFCSWVCPYHLVAEWAEKIHLFLAKKKLVKDHEFHRGTRTVFWVLFAILSVVTGYTVYETISPTGILSRALIYGPGLALGWIALLLLFEVAYSRRAWCRYVCPIGLTYGVVGTISPLRIKYSLEHCMHEGDCRKVCLVPHVLDMVVKGRAAEAEMPVGPDCTRCGLCIDACPSGALRYEVKGLSKLL